jgi:hypothetical protein
MSKATDEVPSVDPVLPTDTPSSAKTVLATDEVKNINPALATDKPRDINAELKAAMDIFLETPTKHTRDRQNLLKVIVSLVEEGASVNTQHDGFTPLMCAMLIDPPGTKQVEALLKHEDIVVTTPNNNRRTAVDLMFVNSSGEEVTPAGEVLMRYLSAHPEKAIAQKVSVSQEEQERLNTKLLQSMESFSDTRLIADKEKCLQKMDDLVRQGADISTQNVNGMNPIDLAVSIERTTRATSSLLWHPDVDRSMLEAAKAKNPNSKTVGLLDKRLEVVNEMTGAQEARDRTTRNDVAQKIQDTFKKYEKQHTNTMPLNIQGKGTDINIGR